MGSHVVHINAACPQCSHSIAIAHRVSTREGSFRTGESSHCANCGDALEADGDELLPEVKVAMIEAEGAWGLWLLDLGHLMAIRALRTLLDLTPTEATRLAKQSGPVLIGARVEAERVEEVLTGLGASVELRRTGPVVG